MRGIMEGSAALIQEDVEMYGYMGAVTLLAFFVSWSADFCCSVKKPKLPRRRQAAVGNREKEVEMKEMDESKDDPIRTTRNPMHQEIDINNFKGGMQSKKTESNFKLSLERQSLLKTLASNLLVLLFVFINAYILLTSWLYTINRSEASEYFT